MIVELFIEIIEAIIATFSLIITELVNVYFTSFLSATDHIKAATQPKKVQPINIFKTNIPNFLFPFIFRDNAIHVDNI